MIDLPGAVLAWFSTKTGAIVAVCCAAALLVSGFFIMRDNDTEDPQTTSSPSETITPAPAAPTGVPDINPTAAPSVDPSQTPTPSIDVSALSGTDGEDENPNALHPLAWQPTSDRQPQEGDEAAGRTLIESVIPTWAAADLTPGVPTERWISTWDTIPGAGPDFLDQSEVRFTELWGGAIRAGFTVPQARLVSVSMLWNGGSDSLWRVVVVRDLVGISSDALNTTEQVSWDIQVSQIDGGSPSLTNFQTSVPANEAPETYLPRQ